MTKEVQVVRCSCGVTFAASIIPDCYSNAKWQKDVRKYIDKGCTVEFMNVKDFELDFCNCHKKK